jgi:hypothetical protein
MNGKEPGIKPRKIFVFINSGAGTEWVNGCALAEDGVFVAGHLSSSEGWFEHDMGLCSSWKHDLYKAHFPDGYELVYVANGIKEHPGIKAAYELHLKANENQEVKP